MRGLFVVGAPRSGTTLARRVLTSHPRVNIAKETGFLGWEPAVSLLESGQAFDARSREALYEAARPRLGWEGWDLEQVRALLDESADLPEFYKKLCLVGSCEGEEIEFWGDNTPKYVLLLRDLLQWFPESKAVFMVRDPRAVANSVMKLHFGSTTATMAAADWVYYMAHGLAACQAYPDRVHLLRYEDLVTDPEGHVAEVASFLGISDEFEVNPSAAGLGRMGSHHANLTRPIDPALAVRWKSELSDRDRLRVEEQCQWLGRSLGYDMAPGLRRSGPDAVFLASTVEMFRWYRKRTRRVMGKLSRRVTGRS